MEAPQKFIGNRPDLEAQTHALDPFNKPMDTVPQCSIKQLFPLIEPVAVKPGTNWSSACCRAGCREHPCSKVVILLCVVLFLTLGLFLLLWNYYCIIVQHLCSNEMDPITPHLTMQPTQESAGILIQDPVVSF